MQRMPIISKHRRLTLADYKNDSQYGIGHLINRLYIHWDLLTKCNFHCSYCYAKDWYTKSNQWNLESPLARQKFIIKCIEKAQLPVFLGILGGEPTEDENLDLIIRMILKDIIPRHPDNRVYITTNLYNYVEFPQNDKLFVLCSYHPEFRYAKRFVSNVKKIKNKVRINLMLIPGYENDLKFIFNELSDFDIHPHFVYKNHRSELIYNVFDEFKEMRQKHREFVYDGKLFSDFELLEQNKNCYYNWLCYNNNYEISFDGNVKNLCLNSSKSLYLDPNFFAKISEIDAMRCPHEFCNCDGLLKCFKIKDNNSKI